MKYPFLAALVVALAACGAYSFPAASPAGTGTVSGTVLSVPCTPVVTGNNPCSGRPVAGVQITFTNGATVDSTKTSNRGSYSIQLAPGTWKVSIQSFGRLLSGPASVTVVAGQKVDANYLVDSGIREPVVTPLS